MKKDFLKYVESKKKGLKIIELKGWGVTGMMLSEKLPFAFFTVESIDNHPDDFLIPVPKTHIQKGVRLQTHFVRNLRHDPLGFILLLELLDGGFSINVRDDWMKDDSYVYVPTSNLKPL